MRIARYLCMLLLWLTAAPAVWADDLTPLPATAPPVLSEPTVPPAVDTAPTAAAPVVDSSPIAPAREYSQPTAVVPESGVPPSAPTVAPRYETGRTAPGVTLNPNPPAVVRPVSPSAQPVSPAPSSVTVSPSVVQSPPPAQLSSITSQTSAVSAQAPAQLTCRGKQSGTALPFLVSPYAAWTELVSFLDHDSPDYTVDGTIALANGITATTADGQASDLFPSYWSPSLRQFVNYDGHNGYDFALNYQPVLAAGTGTVKFAGWNSSDEFAGYGEMVLIDHHNGYVTLYGHLSKLEVQAGDKVTAGQEIGISGTTGHSSGPHLHFSVFHNCRVTDPYGWTGRGTDPLFTFDGEHASYLWLPGHDPLVVNPPRDWPTFPLGLHLSISSTKLVRSLSSHAKTRRTPPIDRLLLLDLPASHHVGTASSAVAIARTEAAITQEAEALTPALQDLKSQGLVDSYQLVTAAAAVWLRGTASAAQLLSLPGVASLSGVQSHDLSAAQSGLSHAVLIQIRQQQAPSLWPLGFRSALHAWRPMMTVLNRHALVSGLALPGQHVVVSLKRRGEIVGVAETMADPSTGGFVVMLHDTAGNSVTTGPRDSVVVNCGAKSDTVTILPLELKARTGGVSGFATAHASVPVTLTRVGGSIAGETVVTAGSSGAFGAGSTRFTRTGALAAGGLTVATVADAAGDQEAASAFVPGAVLYLGTSLVRGWTVGSSPRLLLIRRHHVLLQQRIRSAPDGTFQMELHRRGRLVTLRAGDIVRIGSRWHARTLTLPRLRVAMQSGSRRVGLTGPPHAPVTLTVNKANGQTVGKALRTDGSGGGEFTVAGGPLSVGDSATLRFITSSGDQIYARQQTRGILIREGVGTVTGTVRAGAVLSIHALTRDGAAAAGAVVTADRVTGGFRVVLRNSSGAAVRLSPGMQVLVRDSQIATSTTVPLLSVTRVGRRIVSKARARPYGAVTWTGIDIHGGTQVRQLHASKYGVVVDRYAPDPTSPNLDRVELTMPAGDGTMIERTLVLSHVSKSVRPRAALSGAPRCAGAIKRASDLKRHVSGCTAGVPGQ